MPVLPSSRSFRSDSGVTLIEVGVAGAVDEVPAFVDVLEAALSPGRQARGRSFSLHPVRPMSKRGAVITNKIEARCSECFIKWGYVYPGAWEGSRIYLTTITIAVVNKLG